MLYSYFINNTNKTNTKFFFGLLLLLVISILTMQFFDASLKNEMSPNGIISFELAKELPHSLKIIENWKKEDVLVYTGLSIGFDFFFILVYTFFISLVIFIITNKKIVWLKYLGKILFWVIFFAGFMDVLENIFLIKILLGNTNQLLAPLAFYAASTKFLFLSISILYIVVNSLVLMIKKLIKH